MAMCHLRPCKRYTIDLRVHHRIVSWDGQAGLTQAGLASLAGQAGWPAWQASLAGKPGWPGWPSQHGWPSLPGQPAYAMVHPPTPKDPRSYFAS